MNIQAVYHNPKSNQAFATKIDELCIRIQVAKGDFDKIMLVNGVKYHWDNRVTSEMKKVFTDTLFDTYEYTIKQNDTRIAYYFELYKDNKKYHYLESGFSIECKDVQHFQFFQFPYISEVDLHKIPSWADEAIFYQIFPDRFYSGDNNEVDEKLWSAIPTRGDQRKHFGGTLKGITDKLDYLYDLGINAIYLTPIFKAITNHKYDTEDYMDIAPEFGTKQDFKELVDEAHKRGIKIVLDAVYNHCGFEFPYFQDVVKKGEDSKYKDWFHIENFPVDTVNKNYKSFAEVNTMPKLNTTNPETKEFLLNVSEYWIKEFNIDGWRLDVSDEVDHKFWRDFRDTVKKANPEAIIIGENWHDSYPWLMGDQFDSVMNYPIRTACDEYFAKNEIDSIEFQRMIIKAYLANTKQVNTAMLNLLDSHDIDRFLTKCNEDVNSLKNALTFIFGYVGMPCIYYGSEIGLLGGADPDNRRTFNWDASTWDKDVFDFYKKIISIRKNEKALTKGEVEIVNDEKYFIMKRTFETEVIYVVCNNSDTSYTLSVLDGEYIDLMTGKKYTSNDSISGKKSMLLKKC